jgi:predicted enzyme involved in methoxymalonyl-ACP biosynthesis
MNKTNQFNLNGKRYTEGSWLRYLKQLDTILMVASYKDKFGPLGKIAVLSGRVSASGFVIEAWVMSCRAFAWRIIEFVSPDGPDSKRPPFPDLVTTP